jgi:type IV secretory pathway TraG/TraD family ATPase VirD4
MAINDKQIIKLEGFELRNSPPNFSSMKARFRLDGLDRENKPAFLPLSDELLSTHILVLGGIKTGKTNSIYQIVSQLRKLMTPNDVVVIFDTKGDFYREFYRQGDIVISNDANATGANGKDYWNIFRELGQSNDIESNIAEISKTLFYEKIRDNHQKFFPNAAKDLFGGILLHYARTQNQNMNNHQLRQFLNSKDSATEIRSLLDNHPDLQAMNSYIAPNAPNQTQGVMSELQLTIREIFQGNFSKQGTLSIREAIKQKNGRAIFVEYDLGVGNMLTPIYRLLFDLAIKEALSREKSEGNVWFVIDEFRLIPLLQHVDDGVNFGRSLGAKFIIGVQNVSQIFEAYGEQLARSILSGFMTTIAFRVNDQMTKNFIQERFGKNRKLESYEVGTRRIEQVREANVVEDWHIAGLTTGTAIIGIPEQHPFVFRFKEYPTR